jgi:hypothetical protein
MTDNLENETIKELRVLLVEKDKKIEELKNKILDMEKQQKGENK